MTAYLGQSYDPEQPGADQPHAFLRAGARHNFPGKKYSLLTVEPATFVLIPEEPCR
jgi:hypothetical protein